MVLEHRHRVDINLQQVHMQPAIPTDDLAAAVRRVHTDLATQHTKQKEAASQLSQALATALVLTRTDTVHKAPRAITDQAHRAVILGEQRAHMAQDLAVQTAQRAHMAQDLAVQAAQRAPTAPALTRIGTARTEPVVPRAHTVPLLARPVLTESSRNPRTLTALVLTRTDSVNKAPRVLTEQLAYQAITHGEIRRKP